MRRETHDELQERMNEAERQMPRGRFLRHVRSGDEYIVRGHSLRESDLEALTHYSPKMGPVVVFSRPVREMQARFVLSDGEQWPAVAEAIESGTERAQNETV